MENMKQNFHRSLLETKFPKMFQRPLLDYLKVCPSADAAVVMQKKNYFVLFMKNVSKNYRRPILHATIYKSGHP
jgi:hypothetical protein